MISWQQVTATTGVAVDDFDRTYTPECRSCGWSPGAYSVCPTAYQAAHDHRCPTPPEPDA